MADQGKWFKLWVGARRDAQLATLSKEDFAHWCLFGMYLKEQGSEGMTTHQMPAVALQKALEIDNYSDLINVLKRFPNCVVGEEQNVTVTGVTNVTVTWKNWHRYQGDMSVHRTRKWRDRVTAKRRGEEKRGEEKRGDVCMQAPTHTQVLEFAKAEGFEIDAKRFCDFYDSKGWLVGKTPMKDWRPAARNWKDDSRSKETIPAWK